MGGGNDALKLLMYLAQGFARLAPTMFIIDDALYLDESSWQLAEAIAKNVPEVLMVLATRPFIQYFGFRAEPKPYRAIVEMGKK